MRPRSPKLSPALETYLDLAQGGAPRAALSFTARAADLAGCVSGPEDLSTNVTHLDTYVQSDRVLTQRRAARTR